MAISDLIGRGIRDKDEVKRQFGKSDAVLHVFRIMSFQELETRNRWLKVKRRTIENSLILGHVNNGLLGVGGSPQPLLGDFRSAQTTIRIISPENTHREWVYDEEFKDTVVTTANWNATDHEISLV